MRKGIRRSCKRSSIGWQTIVRTFLDKRTLGILEDRAVNEPAARVLYAGQNAFLGRSQEVPDAIKKKEEELSEREKEAARVDPTPFSCDDFVAVVKAAEAVHYGSRKTFMAK